MKYRILLPLVLLAAWLLTALSRIGPDERAVVYRFGRVVAHPGPGLWIGLPWGVDRVDRIAVRTVRQLAVGVDPGDDTGSAGSGMPGRWLTGDQHLVDVRLILDYAVAEDDESLSHFSLQRQHVESVLAREAEALAAEWTAGRGVDDVLLAGRAELPQWIMNHLPKRIAPQRLGVVLLRAGVEHLAAPPEVREAFAAVNQAQTAVHTRETEARRQAEERRQQAETVRYHNARQAEAYRTEVLAAVGADAAAFRARLEQYRKARAANPDALAAIWWDEMGRTLLSLKRRGRLDVLDDRIGKDGLDITQFLPPGAKP